MDTNPIGVIDLGTNTFHLLIVEPLAGGGFQERYRERRFIQLAEEGIEQIGEQAFARALRALEDYHAILREHGVSTVRAFGTAALRTARNGQMLIDAIFEATGIPVQLITGKEEAHLIYLGARQAVPLSDERALIMDIGGGSVEFIIADGQEVFWSQSFPIGVAVLHRDFHHSEPIAPGEKEALEVFLKQKLSPLRQALEAFPCRGLIGASGTFDVLEAVLDVQKKSPVYALLQAEKYEPFYREMLRSTLEDRLKIEGIPPARAAMLVVAIILVQEVIQMAHIREIHISAYAMKEGMLAEMLAG